MRYVVIVAGWLWGLAALPQVTDAGLGFGFLLFPPSGLLIGLTWLVYSGAVPGVFRAPRVRWLWLSVPVIGLGSLLLCFDNYGLTVRVWLCESELREYAEAARQNPDERREPCRVGLFNVRSVSADENQVRLYTSNAGFTDSAGIVYRPEGAPPDQRRRHQHLYGPWWWFWERF